MRINTLNTNDSQFIRWYTEIKNQEYTKAKDSLVLIQKVQGI